MIKTSSGFLCNGPWKILWVLVGPRNIQNSINFGHVSAPVLGSFLYFSVRIIVEGLPVAVLMGGTLAADVARGILGERHKRDMERPRWSLRYGWLKMLRNCQRVLHSFITVDQIVLFFMSGFSDSCPPMSSHGIHPNPSWAFPEASRHFAEATLGCEDPKASCSDGWDMWHVWKICCHWFLRP